jgi:hypothetical protein
MKLSNMHASLIVVDKVGLIGLQTKESIKELLLEETITNFSSIFFIILVLWKIFLTSLMKKVKSNTCKDRNISKIFSIKMKNYI